MSQPEPPARRSVWLATDVPFWHAANGSHQRIHQLARALHQVGFDLTLWFLGPSAAAMRNRLTASGTWNKVLGPALPPTGLLRRIRWHWQGTRHLFEQLARTTESADSSTAPQSTRHIRDFDNTTIARRFREDVQAHRPDAIIFEYISLSYLAETLRNDSPSVPLLLLDAHDVMSRRTSLFRASGLENWLSMTAEEETNALSLFDVIVAIQDEEAAEFARMVPRRKTIVCGHAVRPATRWKPAGVETCGDSDRPVVLGFISGPGASAEQGLVKFLKTCWPRVQKRVAGQVELRVAGSICRSAALQSDLPEGVRLVGRIDELASWYESLDIAINPIEVGTGLKIKSIEALAYGCPLVTTNVGLEGIRQAVDQGAVAVDAIESMADPIVRLAQDAARRSDQRQAANRYIQSYHAPEQVYGELIRVLSSDFASI